jgi:hypothetical protein
VQKFNGEVFAGISLIKLVLKAEVSVGIPKI